MMTNDQITKMKAKLLMNTTSVVKATVSIEKDSIPEITIYEDITKETAARMAFEVDGYVTIVVEIEDNTLESVEAGVFRARELIYRRMEDLGL